jgi:hypothetical protein
VAEDDGADGPHEKPDGERAERGKQRHGPVARGEELLGEDRREKAVDREVVPLEHVADHAGREHAPQRPSRGSSLTPSGTNCNAHRRSVHLSAGSVVG